MDAIPPNITVQFGAKFDFVHSNEHIDDITPRSESITTRSTPIEIVGVSTTGELPIPSPAVSWHQSHSEYIKATCYNGTQASVRSWLEDTEETNVCVPPSSGKISAFNILDTPNDVRSIEFELAEPVLWIIVEIQPLGYFHPNTDPFDVINNGTVSNPPQEYGLSILDLNSPIPESVGNRSIDLPMPSQQVRANVSNIGTLRFATDCDHSHLHHALPPSSSQFSDWINETSSVPVPMMQSRLLVARGDG